MASLLNILDQAVFVSDRSGRVLFANLQGQDLVNDQDTKPKPKFNLFEDILHFDVDGILEQFQRGEQEVNLPLESPDGKSQRLEFVGYRNRIGLLLLWSPPSLRVRRMKRRCARRSRN